MKKTIILILLLTLLSACAAQNKIVIKDEAPWYFPGVLEIEPGTTVEWENMGAVVHPVNTLNAPEEFSSGHFTKTYERKFDTPGIYHYFCPVHPYMQGLIGVGMEVPQDMIPYWTKQWPPATADEEIPGPLPTEPGKGEVWLDAQFQMIPGKEKPGAIIVIDAETWKIKKTIDDKRLNNPHNMWPSPNPNHILQTNWFDQYLSVIDKYSGLLIKHVYVGESPAHVVTNDGKIYVTLQGADGIAILDGVTYNVEKTLKTVEGEHTHAVGQEHGEPGRGPHGNWAENNRMSVAHTEGGSMSVWDLTTNKKILEKEVGVLPLMAGITKDGKKAWSAGFGDGNFIAVEIDTKETITEYNVGKGPVQLIPSPDEKYILAALTGDAAIAIIDGQTFELIKTLPSGAGAHGVYYGPKKNGGWYAYVSNKFVTWITVVDMDTLEIAGHIPLPKDSLGGQGILAVY